MAPCRSSARRNSSPGCPTLLGLGPDDLVVYPTMAYPTYQVGAVIAGCRAIACDDLDQLGRRAAGAGLDQFAVQPDRADPGTGGAQHRVNLGP